MHTLWRYQRCLKTSEYQLGWTMRATSCRSASNNVGRPMALELLLENCTSNNLVIVKL